MGEVITNLKAKFNVESKDVKKGIDPAEKALQDLDKKVWKSVDGFKNMLTPLALLGAAGGSLALLKGALESIEGPGDRLESVMGGVKESLFEAGKALATLNFTDFFKNLGEGFERGKNFTEMLDELADKSAYNDYRINQLKRESAGLQEIVKNKTLEISVRADAAQKVMKIEEKIRDRRLQLATEEFELQKDLWQDRNDMNADEALKQYEIVDNLEKKVKDRLKQAFDDQTALFGKRKGVNMILSGEAMGGVLKGIPKEVINSYAEYFNLLNTGEKDVLIKLFNTYKNIDEVAYKAQEDYNGTIAQTTKLLAAEEKAAEKVGKTVKSIAPSAGARDPLLDIFKFFNSSTAIKIPEIKMPEFAPVVAKLKELKREVKKLSIDISDVIKSGLEDSLAGFGEWIGEFAVGMATGEDLVKLVGSVFGGMLVQLGKVAIAAGVGMLAIKEAFKNPFTAIAAGIGLIALGTAISSAVNDIGKSIGSGSGGSSGGNSNTFDSRSTSYRTQPVEVFISGEFELKNNVLKAALDKENKRRGSTT